MSEKAEEKQLDFNLWMSMAQNDPEKFELMRLEAIDELIESVPEDRRIHLRRLQWRIDRIRERAGTPLAATIEISKLMWNAFYELRDHYQVVLGKETSATSQPAAPRQSAQILNFRQAVQA